jgi:hypothetical protein
VLVLFLAETEYGQQYKVSCIDKFFNHDAARNAFSKIFLLFYSIALLFEIVYLGSVLRTSVMSQFLRIRYYEMNDQLTRQNHQLNRSQNIEMISKLIAQGRKMKRVI